MITENDIRLVTLHAWEMSIVRAMAGTWDFPGRSSIRSREERTGTLGIDALVGQLGTYGGLKLLYGAGAVKEYLTSRWHANRRKFDSDGGSDVDALNFDFKATLRRDSSKPLLSYNLAVRPRELYDAWVYLFAIIDQLADDRALVHLLGWASTNMLPSAPSKDGPLAGAHVLQARKLHPLPPFKWRYFERGAACLMN